jgi:hypothetical protein
LIQFPDSIHQFSVLWQVHQILVTLPFLINARNLDLQQSVPNARRLNLLMNGNQAYAKSNGNQRQRTKSNTQQLDPRFHVNEGIRSEIE